MLNNKRIEGVVERCVANTVTSPILYDSPHSGIHFPPEFRSTLETGLLLHTADLYVNELISPAINNQSAYVHALFPRSYIDVNRAADDIDVRLIDGNWPHRLNPTDKSRMGKGLIWRVAASNRSIYARRLKSEEISNRIRLYYDPYHELVSETLEFFVQRFSKAFLIDCHSMKSRFAPVEGGAPAINRPDIVISDRDGSTAKRDLRDFLVQFWENLGYCVFINDPFKGAEIISRYGRDTSTCQAIQIEFNRKLYMDERSLRKSAGFCRLREHVDDMMKKVSLFIKETY